MKKNLFYLVLIILTSSLFSTLNAQNRAEKIWKLLLENKRKEALDLVKKIKDNNASDEELILKQIVLYENGYLSETKNFVKALVKRPYAPYYIYALSSTQLLVNYNEYSEINKTKIDYTDILYDASVNNPAVEALVAEMKHYYDFSQYRGGTAAEILKKVKPVNQWQYCGVFENLNNSGMDIPYEPETKAVSDKPFNANSNGMINWYTPSFNGQSLFATFFNHSEYGNGINYAQSFFSTTKPAGYIFKIGVSGPVKMWIDDVLVLEQTLPRPTVPDAYAVKVHLPAGKHRVLVKADNDDSWFILRVFNAQNKLIDPASLHFTSQYSPYHKATEKELQPEKLVNPFETFFKNPPQGKYTSFFKDYMLFNTYMLNYKNDEAKAILDTYLEKYPKSSLIRNAQYNWANHENDNNLIKEIKENLKNDDPDYYISLLFQLIDTEKLFKMPVDQMNELLDKISRATDNKIIKYTAEFYKAIRAQDVAGIKSGMRNMYIEGEKFMSPKIMLLVAALYYQILQEPGTSEKIISDMLKKLNVSDAYELLITIYKEQNKKSQVVKTYENYISHTPDWFKVNVLENYASDLYDFQKYKKMIPVVDQGLKLFPYSFVLMEKKGDALHQLGKDKEALKLYEQAFKHNSADGSLRKKIRDLKKEKDPFDKIKTKDVYAYIKKHRGKESPENHDINILLDESNVEIFKEGGSRTRSIYAYEVTSDQGVEDLKEFNLGLRGNYIIYKSEIVKPGGKVVPAERSGSYLVFNSLSPGDVIYIDYEVTYNQSGRFYKDFTDKNSMTQFYPVYKSVYRLLSPQGIIPQYRVANGKATYEKSKLDQYTLETWIVENAPALPPDEPYRPANADIKTMLHLSTIKNWNQISNWYSDLVRTQMKEDHLLNKTFNEIFPHGYQQLSEEERARKIYNYMADNLTYSYVNFKQSGYIPQKPSKTIKTKLGDCKDFSTLFITLAKKAGLKANIVLVSTADRGKNYAILPSINFNHAIARVYLDGKPYLLELTNKYLPFKTVPVNLDGAIILDIPEKTSNQPNNIKILQHPYQLPATKHADIVFTIGKNSKQLHVAYRLQGRNSAGFRKMASNKNEKELKKNLTERFENLTDLDLTLKNYKITDNNKKDGSLTIEADFDVNTTFQKLGRMKVLNLPVVNKAYTDDLVNLETRHYPVVYAFYEDTDDYYGNYTVKLKDGLQFAAVPENENFKYKNHYFKITYTKKSPSELKVTIRAHTDIRDITPEEYPAFRQYVKNALDARDALIGFK